MRRPNACIDRNNIDYLYNIYLIPIIYVSTTHIPIKKIYEF